MLKKYLTIFLISMVPILELRGAIPYSVGFGLPSIPSFIVCVIGNMIPVPFIYLAIRIAGIYEPITDTEFRRTLIVMESICKPIASCLCIHRYEVATFLCIADQSSLDSGSCTQPVECGINAWIAFHISIHRRHHEKSSFNNRRLKVLF